MIDEELKRLLDAMRQENAAAHADTRRHFDVANEATRHENAAADADTRRHFDVANEATRHEIQLVAESVVQVSETLDRTATALDERIERTASETQAMIKFSHAELDRRMRALEQTQRTLEEGLTDLQVRIERLEGLTH